MKIGLFMPFGTMNAQPELLAAAGRESEDRGFESIWLAEHVVLFDDYESSYPYSPDGRFPGGSDSGLLEPLTGLTFLAAVTQRIRLGTGICLVPQRNPVYTAKQVVDLDNLSNGRVDFGIGIGWLAEEFAAVATPFERRGKRTDEYLDVMHTLWCDELSEYHGELYDLPPCRMYPKPVQQPHPPIHVGGESAAAMRRVARHGQGWYTFNRLPADLPAALEQLDEALGAEGRTRTDIEVTVCPYFNAVDAAALDASEEQGVDRLVLLCLQFDVDSMRVGLDQLVADVLEPARG